MLYNYNERMMSRNYILYKNTCVSFFTSCKVETDCKCARQGQGDEGRGQKTGGRLLYWPFLNQRCDSIFRALRLCFSDEMFSTVGLCPCLWVLADCDSDCLTWVPCIYNFKTSTGSHPRTCTESSLRPIVSPFNCRQPEFKIISSSLIY